MLSSGRLMSDERGAVVVFVALLILPFALLMAFAVDTGNWWTHKRHLQTQADAAAFAGGFGPWFPVCDEGTIEQKAAEYAGETYNEQYQPSGTVDVLLNSTKYFEDGGSSFSDTGPQDDGTPCDKLAKAAGQSGQYPVFLDLKVTESGLANFFGSIPGFSSVTAHARARVEIQGVKQENAVRPIAVRNDALYQCAHAQLWTTDPDGKLDSTLGAEFTSYTRTELPDTSTQFQITGTATMPTKPDSEAPHVGVQILLGNTDCAVTDAYADPEDDDIGVNFINVYDPDQTVGNGAKPAIGSVSMPPGLSADCTPDPYFTANGCTAVVKAYVEFAPGAVTSGSEQNAFVTINDVDAEADTDDGGLYWTASVPIGAQSGPNPITVAWKQTYGTIPGPGPKPKDCSTGQGCSGSFDVAQQSFAATEDEDITNSGKISLVQIADGNGLYANSLEEATTHSFTITVVVKGLQNSLPTDPPIIIKSDVQRSKRTGLVDCGQKNGADADKEAIINGCPAPIYIWPEGTPCVAPPTQPRPWLNPIDCVWPIPGERRQKIASAIEERINGGCNYWNAYRDSGSFEIENYIKPDDPRVLPLIITSPADLSGGTNGDAIPVRALATFYVTGYDGQPAGDDGHDCENEKYPASGSDKFKIWGHYIKYVPVGGGIGNGEWCDPAKFGDCIAVLTQ